MQRRTLVFTTILVLVMLASAACSAPALSVAQNVPPAVAAAPASLPLPAASATPSADGLSSADVSAIQSVILKGNQEQVQAIATQNPAVMQDTATASYYQQSVQTVNDLLSSGVTAIQLVNLNWGPITRKDATTAQATTSETWGTTFSDGSTLKETDTNVYTLVLENGVWKVQDDQHPNTGAGQPAANNPSGPTAPAASVPAAGQSTSRNWSGYAATDGTFTAVSGTWTVPNVDAGATGMDATWIGIGGVNSTDLIQAGTQATVQSGQVVYSAWWETLPQASQDVPLTVNAGDKVNVSIKQQSDGTWQILISDATNGQLWQKNVTYQSSLSSAEWVEEAPAAGRRVILPLDNFGSVTFTAGTTVENGKTQTIAQAHAQPITMDSGNGQALAQASALDANGTSFTVTRTAFVAPSVSLNGRRGSSAQSLP